MYSHYKNPFMEDLQPFEVILIQWLEWRVCLQPKRQNILHNTDNTKYRITRYIFKNIFTGREDIKMGMNWNLKCYLFYRPLAFSMTIYVHYRLFARNLCKSAWCALVFFIDQYDHHCWVWQFGNLWEPNFTINETKFCLHLHLIWIVRSYNETYIQILDMKWHHL